MSTGYFISRNGTQRTAAHYVLNDKPICGAKVQLRTYQVCAAGFSPYAVECRRCKHIVQRSERLAREKGGRG